MSGNGEPSDVPAVVRIAQQGERPEEGRGVVHRRGLPPRSCGALRVWPGALLALFVLLVVVAAVARASEQPSRIENLAAYARLLSLLRFFHPSDEAAAADWREVAIGGIETAEAAAGPAPLAAALERYFAPLAPTLRVVPAGGTPSLPPALEPPPGDGPFRIVVWRHHAGDFGGRSEVFASERIDDHTPAGYGTLAQAIGAGELRGRQVRLRAYVRVVSTMGGFARLRLRVDRPGGRADFLDPRQNRPIRDPTWHVVEIEGGVAADAEQIAVLFVLTGGGSAWLDEVTLRAADGSRTAPLANSSFDEGASSAQPPGWTFPYPSIHAGYHLVFHRGGECRQGGCAEIASDEIATPRFGSPADIERFDLGAGVIAAVPTSLWADARGTLPHLAPATAAEGWSGIDPGADTRAARLAAVALAWGIGQHLHPEMAADDPRWQQTLLEALAAADRASDSTTFRRGFLRFLAGLGDVRTGQLSRARAAATLPVAWAWVDDRLIITGVDPAADGLRIGDQVTTLDGVNAEQAIADAVELVGGPSLAVRRWLALDRLAAGSQGSSVRLGIRRQGAGAFVATLRRGPASIVPDTPLPRIAEPRPGVLYVDLRRLADKDLEALWPRLAAARGLVFDLRGQTAVSTVLLSHLARETARSSNWQVPVILHPNHRGLLWLTTFWSIEPRPPRLGAKVAFVIDERALATRRHCLA